MSEHECKWAWTDLHRSHLVKDMAWKCTRCPAVVSIAEAEVVLNEHTSLKRENERLKKIEHAAYMFIEHGEVELYDDLEDALKKDADGV